jgi:Na+-transporting NADH:ubiquinone oxidoreductase subunit F
MILLSIQSTIIITSIIFFLVVTLLLVGLLLFAKAKLTPSGSVKIDINEGEKSIEVEPGSTLLSTLGNNGIFLPSACGGGGTCGMCRCQVEEGGGSILPTEVGYFTRKEQQNNWRLGCQVKVREDLKIHVPEEVMGIKKWECEVVSNNNVATFIKEFVVRLPEGETLTSNRAVTFKLMCPNTNATFSKDIDVDAKYRDEWDKFNLWGLKINNTEETYRAYSMANHPAEGNIVMLEHSYCHSTLGPRKEWLGQCESWNLFVVHFLAQTWR